MIRYTDRYEAIHREIIEPIEAGDATACEFDVDAIAAHVLLGHEDGYALDPDVDFWAVVQEHAR